MTSIPTSYYTITAHGGIGDEHPDSVSEKPKHNLSASCHELAIHFHDTVVRLLIDIGAYQGRGSIERNVTKIASGVHAILLTHPHMDHIGELPMVFSQESDFDGKIFSTAGTKQGAEIALIDAAKIMARDYEKRMSGYRKMCEEVKGALVEIKKGTKGNKTISRAKNGDRKKSTDDLTDTRSRREEAYTLLEHYGFKNMDQKEIVGELHAREPKKPLYGLEEVARSLSRMTVVGLNSWNELIPRRVAFRLYNAGHIIGSVSILFRITENRKHTYVLFSGDLGSYKWDIHPTGLPVPPHNLPIDTIAALETTYGNKVRENFDRDFLAFQHEVQADLKKYERIIVSTFAMDRTQNMLYRIIKMKQDGIIPQDIDIVLDSPAGIKHTMNYVRETAKPDATIHMKHAPSIHKSLKNDFILAEQNALTEFNTFIDPKNGYYSIATTDNREGLVAMDATKKKIIITASGMADGGMVLSHLEQNIGNPNVVFYFPGYLVPGTLGYDLANEHQPGGQKKKVIVNGESQVVKARMKQFNFLSGHADAEDLETWLKAIKLRDGSNILLVHGDVNGSSLEFQHRLERKGFANGKNIIVPNLSETREFSLNQPKTRKKV